MTGWRSSSRCHCSSRRSLEARTATTARPCARALECLPRHRRPARRRRRGRRRLHGRAQPRRARARSRRLRRAAAGRTFAHERRVRGAPPRRRQDHHPVRVHQQAGAAQPVRVGAMRTHTLEGERLLRQIGGRIAEVGAIVRSCHERWDGDGYPDGLAGEEIPLRRTDRLLLRRVQRDDERSQLPACTPVRGGARRARGLRREPLRPAGRRRARQGDRHGAGSLAGHAPSPAAGRRRRLATLRRLSDHASAARQLLGTPTSIRAPKRRRRRDAERGGTRLRYQTGRR